MDVKRLDRTGHRYGRLVVVAYSHTKGGAYWLCRCDCGNKRVILGKYLAKGQESCGCFRNEQTRERLTQHGLSKRPEFRVWTGMIHRCQNSNASSYPDYGGRGITVCERWQSFASFYTDMGPRPSSEHTIERIDNDGGYTPENCRWATRKDQGRNTRRNRPITFNGRTQLLTEWAEELGVSVQTLANRLNYCGWSVERALTTPALPNDSSRQKIGRIQGKLAPANSPGGRLRSLRIAHGMAQRDVAARLGMSKITWGNYERGTVRPSDELIERAAALFGVDPSEITSP